MKNIIFIAPPAAGKGTQSDLLVEKYGYIHISTGDLLRSEVASESELGKKLKDIMASGELVSDDITTELLKKRLLQDDVKEHGFILDGYPRNLNQADTLDEILSELNIKDIIAIYLDMDEVTAMHRALGRVTCPNCKRGYNIYEEIMKPKVDNICDSCGSTLEHRSDDNEDTFKIRFNTYLENTSPLLDYYKNKDLLSVIDNSGTPDETFNKIESVIK